MRVAIPKGRLYEGALRAMRAYDPVLTPTHARSYRMRTSMPGLEAQIYKARAIPQLVALGIVDAGFCGIDLLREADVDDALPSVDLGTECVRIIVAANDKDVIRAFPRRPLVIATEYPCIASRWALGANLAHIILQTYGSTEGYVPGSADLAIDCIDTGDTMRANGLVEIAEITRSSTHLIVNRQALAQNRMTPLIDALINGVQNAKWAGDA